MKKKPGAETYLSHLAIRFWMLGIERSDCASALLSKGLWFGRKYGLRQLAAIPEIEGQHSIRRPHTCIDLDKWRANASRMLEADDVIDWGGRENPECNSDGMNSRHQRARMILDCIE